MVDAAVTDASADFVVVVAVVVVVTVVDVVVTDAFALFAVVVVLLLPVLLLSIYWFSESVLNQPFSKNTFKIVQIYYEPELEAVNRLSRIKNIIYYLLQKQCSFSSGTSTSLGCGFPIG